MLQQNAFKNQYKNLTQRTLSTAFLQLGISSLLRQSGIVKACGHSTFTVFRFLLLLVFHQKNLFTFLHSKQKEKAVSKNTYYRFLNNNRYNWKRFLLSLSAKIVSKFNALTHKNRVKCLVLDDTPLKRNCSKFMELLSRAYDHSEHKFYKGFTMLTLGWTDGYSFIPTGFTLHASAKKKNQLCPINADIDKRTTGYKRRKEALMTKPEAAIKLVKEALDAGIMADYVLMDTWFTHEPLIRSIIEEGLHVIGRVKKDNRKYQYNDKLMTIKEIFKKVKNKQIRKNDCIGSVCVKTKNGIEVKIVFIKHRSKADDWLAILTTDCQLSDAEIVRLYGNRWRIEVFFKTIKSYFQFGKEFQGRSYDMLISHTSIVFTRYLVFEWLIRQENDAKTIGELFLHACDDIPDIDYEQALQSLMHLIREVTEETSDKTSDITEIIKKQVHQWMSLQANYIQALFVNLGWES